MPHPAAGFFGKLPSAGDFVQRRLPASFVDAWDQHFEGAVAQSRAMIGGDWHEAYHASPVWRFLLSPRVCGDAAWLGVMGPGTDRVGRCFPMVIASALSADSETCRQALVHGASWCDEAERMHATAQRDGSISVDAFDEFVASLPAPLDAAATSAVGPDGIDWNVSTHWRLPLAESGNAGARLERCWQQLASVAGPWCLWWTSGSGRVPATLLVTRGLPHADAYAGFLDARQSGMSWRSAGTFESLPVSSPSPASPKAHAPSVEIIAAAPASKGASAPVAAWLPDDLNLLDGLGSVEPVAVAEVAPSVRQDPAALSETASLEQPIASVGVIDRPDCALTAVAAQVGKVESRQQAIAAVTAICRQMTPAAMAAGLQVLCSQILAVSPRLHLASEDLIDPVLEDCAVIAAQLSGSHAQLLKIGAASAWHWRSGRLQPLFSGASPSLPAASQSSDDFNDLLFQQDAPALPGLGATARPECAEIHCEIVAGDRLLLVATPVLTGLPPDVLVRSLAMPSCDDARRNLALAVGLGADPAQWPLAIIEIAA